MAESATTAGRIARCAQELADAHGLDGFTMVDLAARAEVSRRTLFNHVPGKIDAVLGPPPQAPEPALARFRDGGPTGDLVGDLRVLAEAMLTSVPVERSDLARSRRLLTADRRLLGAAHERMVSLSEQLVEEVVTREGAGFGRERARVAVAVIAAILHVSLDAFLDDPGRRPLVDHFDTSLAQARALLR